MSFKSFIDWLRGEKGIGPNSLQEKAKVQWMEKRRDNRVDLEISNQLIVRLKNPDENDNENFITAEVKNVSIRGGAVVFQNADDKKSAPLGKTFLAYLGVNDLSVPLTIEVVREIGDLCVGVKFKPPFPRELERLEKFLEPRCLGRSLREIDSEKLQKTPKKGLQWFQGVNETSLFSWANPESNDIVQQQLVFLGLIVEWKQTGGVKTGRVMSDQLIAEGDKGWVQAELLEFDAKIDKAVIEQALSLMESAPIDPKVKEKFLEKVKTA
jgi:hypothetical protein